MLKVPLHADLACKHSPCGYVVPLIQADELVIDLSGSEVVVALFHTDEGDCVPVQNRHYLNAIEGGQEN